MRTKRLTELSLLTAAALIIFIVELRLPDLSAIPGVKLGLANIITVYAVYRYTAKEVGLIVVTRVLLGSIFGGNLSAILYSMAGAAFCLVGMLLMKRVIPPDYLWLCSIFGAIFHNIGQMTAALLIMRTLVVLGYFPVLMVSGCVAGLFTGLCAQRVLARFDRRQE